MDISIVTEKFLPVLPYLSYLINMITKLLVTFASFVGIDLDKLYETTTEEETTQVSA